MAAWAAAGNVLRRAVLGSPPLRFSLFPRSLGIATSFVFGARMFAERPEAYVDNLRLGRFWLRCPVTRNAVLSAHAHALPASPPEPSDCRSGTDPQVC